MGKASHARRASTMPDPRGLKSAMLRVFWTLAAGTLVDVVDSVRSTDPEDISLQKDVLRHVKANRSDLRSSTALEVRRSTGLHHAWPGSGAWPLAVRGRT